MSAARETQNKILTAPAVASAKPSPLAAAEAWTTGMLSSVRFGVVLLVLLALACMVGMLIMQVNVEGFDKYYAELTPSQRLLYGTLGFFDIYHSWYFNAMLLVLSLNIVLSSIDHLPKAWTYISRKKLDASAHWLGGQDQHTTVALEGESARAVAERIGEACRGLKLRPRVTEKAGKTFVFAERGAWNRLGAYAVHVGLLVIFVGGFLTSQFGHTGQMIFEPGTTSSEMSETILKLDAPEKITVGLPFEVECTDIQQNLLDKGGPVGAMNTLDWLTRIRIKDPARGETEAVVRMNRPFDYRGYRFFQASYVPDGKARSITLLATPAGDAAAAAPQKVTIQRNGSATLADGTYIKLADFYSYFVLNGDRADTQSPDFNNPAAELQIIKASGEVAKAYAFPAGAASAGPMVGRPVAGYKFEIIDFEKVGTAHILSVQKDPGTDVVYVGFVLLALTLAAVFLYAHQRIWAIVEEREGGQFEVIIGGNTNRNKLAFEDRFRRLVKAISREAEEVQGS